MKLFEDSLPPSEENDKWDEFYYGKIYTQSLIEEIIERNGLLDNEE